MKLVQAKVGLVIENFYFNFFGILPYYVKGKLKNKKIENGSSSKKADYYSADMKDTTQRIYNFATLVLKPIEDIIRIPIGITEIIVLEKK